MIKLFFDVHDGKVWGLPGRLLMDLTALILAFLSLSALLIWAFPKIQDQQRRFWYSWLRGLFKFCFQKHLKWSIWFGLPLFLLGATGMFMRPPLLVVLAERYVPALFYPGPLPENPWFQKIKSATYLPSEDQLIIEADGLWKMNLKKTLPAQSLSWLGPVHVMGTTYFAETEPSQFLLGSFSGLLSYNPESGEIIDAITGRAAPDRSRIRAHEYRVTGYFESPDGRKFMGTHRHGLVEITNRGPVQPTDLYVMPPEVDAMPLWDYMFELHNGRIFGHWLGIWSKLLVPLASILYVVLSLSGFFDWYILSIYRKRKNKP